jgi:hypothetical protein
MKLNRMTGMAGVMIMLFISLSIQTCRVNKISEERDIAEADKATAIQFATGEKNKTEVYINKFNNSVARTKAAEVSLSNVNALRKTDRLEHLKEVEGLKKNLKNLESTATVTAEIKGDKIPFQTVYLPCKDSIKAFHYLLTDKWNNIDAMVLDTPKFDIKVPIQSTVYWKRKTKVLWFRVGKKEWIIESTSPNTLVQITSQDLIKVSKR